MVIGAVMLVNWNASRMRMQTTGFASAKAQDNIASKGFAQFASGGSVTTAAAQQGASQCVSTYKTDTPNAQCQAFCNVKFKKFHCMWCKCRACDFCPKGGEAIEEAAKAAPPPFSPPPSPMVPPPANAVLAPTDGSDSGTDAAPGVSSAPAFGDKPNASSEVEGLSTVNTTRGAQGDAIPTMLATTNQSEIATTWLNDSNIPSNLTSQAASPILLNSSSTATVSRATTTTADTALGDAAGVEVPPQGEQGASEDAVFDESTPEAEEPTEQDASTDGEEKQDVEPEPELKPEADRADNLETELGGTAQTF